MSEEYTKEDVESMAKKALKHMGMYTKCPKCGESILMSVFWFDCNNQAYRVCPNCSERVYG